MNKPITISAELRPVVLAGLASELCIVWPSHVDAVEAPRAEEAAGIVDDAFDLDAALDQLHDHLHVLDLLHNALTWLQGTYEDPAVVPPQHQEAVDRGAREALGELASWLGDNANASGEQLTTLARTVTGLEALLMPTFAVA